MRRKSLIACIVCGSLVIGCQAQDRTTPSDGATNPSVRRDLPVPDPSLDREFLLLALHRTASATAIGEDDGRIQHELDGKRFQLRLRFGCPGEVAGARSTRNWKLDRDGQSVAL